MKIDKNKVLKVCIDDFAFKKRYSYGTIMVDIESHRIIDLLDSREKEPVTQWLKTFPNLEIISRDGSLTYSSAISDSHPSAIQVSDRFHLLKNLSEAIEKYMLRLFPARLEIPATEASKTPEMQALLNTRNRAQRIRFSKLKYSEGFTVSEIALVMHASISTINKYLLIKDEDIPEDINSARERQHKEAMGKTKQKIENVKQLYEQGCSIEEICRITGHISQTIRKYLSGDCSLINGHYDYRRPGKLQKYEKEILELRSQGITYPEITKIIHAKGYDGSIAALRVFMQKEREHQKNSETSNSEHNEYIARKWMIQLIYRDIEKVKGITPKQYEEVVNYGNEILPCDKLFLFNLYNADKWKSDILGKESRAIKGIMSGKKEYTPEEYECFVRKVSEAEMFDRIDFMHYCTCCIKIDDNNCALTCIKENDRIWLELRVLPELRDDIEKKLGFYGISVR